MGVHRALWVLAASVIRHFQVRSYDETLRASFSRQRGVHIREGGFSFQIWVASAIAFAVETRRWSLLASGVAVPTHHDCVSVRSCDWHPRVEMCVLGGTVS